MEKKCEYCAMMIPKEAKICPHCRKKQRVSGILWLLAIILILILIGTWEPAVSNKSNDTSAASIAKIPPPVIKYQPVLELQSWSWHKESGYAIAEGVIKNISFESIDNVVAVMLTYDKQDTFIKADDALIDYRPILPGQASPFKIMSSYNPAMKMATVDFRTFRGETLLWKNKEKKKK